MKKFITHLLLIVIFFTIALTGCSSNKNEKITVSEVTHSVFYAPQYVAINLGFFEKGGLNLSSTMEVEPIRL